MAFKNRKNKREDLIPDKKRIKKKNRKKGGPWMSDFYYGRALSAEFFRSNSWFLVIFVAAVIALMGLRYDTKTKMQEIQRLTTELERAESSKLQEKAEYMSLIRETEMQKLIRERGLPLQYSEQPPYELVISENN